MEENKNLLLYIGHEYGKLGIEINDRFEESLQILGDVFSKLEAMKITPEIEVRENGTIEMISVTHDGKAIFVEMSKDGDVNFIVDDRSKENICYTQDELGSVLEKTESGLYTADSLVSLYDTLDEVKENDNFLEKLKKINYDLRNGQRFYGYQGENTQEAVQPREHFINWHVLGDKTKEVSNALKENLKELGKIKEAIIRVPENIKSTVHLAVNNIKQTFVPTVEFLNKKHEQLKELNEAINNEKDLRKKYEDLARKTVATEKNLKERAEEIDKNLKESKKEYEDFRWNRIYPAGIDLDERDPEITATQKRNNNLFSKILVLSNAKYLENETKEEFIERLVNNSNKSIKKLEGLLKDSYSDEDSKDYQRKLEKNKELISVIDEYKENLKTINIFKEDWEQHQEDLKTWKEMGENIKLLEKEQDSVSKDREELMKTLGKKAKIVDEAKKEVQNIWDEFLKTRDTKQQTKKVLQH